MKTAKPTNITTHRKGQAICPYCKGETILVENEFKNKKGVCHHCQRIFGIEE